MNKIIKRKITILSRVSLLLFLFLVPLIIQSDLDAKNTSSIIENESIGKNNTLVKKPDLSAEDEFSPVFQGYGKNRSVHVNLRNSSSTTGTNSFNISSANEMEYLSRGAFDFNFTDINHTTTYTLEDNTPLNHPTYEKEDANTSLFVQDGTLNGGNNQSIQDLEDSEFLDLDSETNGDLTLNFTADFSNLPLSGSQRPIQHKKILGFELSVNIESPSILDANLFGFNYLKNSWDEILQEDQSISQENQRLTYSYYFENKNLRYRDEVTKNSSFTLVLSNSSQFQGLEFYGVSIKAIEAEEIPINENSKVALEFDTKGNAKLNGFRAWIRAKNGTRDDIAETSNLTVSVYRTNESGIIRSELLDPLSLKNSQTTTKPNEQDPSALLYRESYLNYSQDELIWINFTKPEAPVSLNISSFFIVVESNCTDDGFGKDFSIVSIPDYLVNVDYSSESDPDQKVDHLFLSNSNGNWGSEIIGDDNILDAAGFGVNITRAFTADELEIKIEGEEIQNALIDPSIYPRDTESTAEYYTQPWWGIGTITEFGFNEPIPNIAANFSIDLTWNETLTHQSEVSFEVNYTVEKYLIDGAISNFTASENRAPNWNVTYNLNQDQFTYWDLFSFGIFVPDDWTFVQYIAKNGSAINENLVRSTATPDYPDIKDSVKEYKIENQSVIGHSSNGDGNYTIEFYSPNYIQDAKTYLNYNGSIYATSGFMVGDNISVSISAADSDGDFVDGNGNASFKFFDTSNAEIVTVEDTIIDSNFSTTFSLYEFNKDVILEIDESDDLGEYTALASWSDGEEIGYTKLNFFINNYSAEFYDVEQINEQERNQIQGKVDSFDTDLEGHSFYIYAVKELTENSEEFIINETIDSELKHDIYLSTFLQNETFINSGEKISLRIGLENKHSTLDFDIKIEAQLISAMNKDWIISNTTSAVKNLAISGDQSGNDEKTFEIELDVPTYTEGGVNCPMRFGPMRIKFDVYFSDNEKIATVNQDDILYYSNSTEEKFEGQIISLRTYKNRIGSYFIGSFDYNSLDLPAKYHYFAQVFNQYYQTMNIESNISKYEKQTSKFSDFKVEQNLVNRTSTINLTGKIINTYEKSISSSPLSFKYRTYNNSVYGKWKELSSKTVDNPGTDSQGKFNIDFDLNKIANLTDKFQIQAQFLGNSDVLASNSSIGINLNNVNNSVSMSFSISKLVVGFKNIIKVKISNEGNSTLTNYSLILSNTQFSGKIRNLTLNPYDTNDEINPGESLSYSLVFEQDNYNKNNANFTLKFSSDVVEQGDSFIYEESYSTNVLRINQEKVYNTISLIIFFTALILFWVFSIKYIREKYYEINKIPDDESVSKKKRKSKRKGKYVKVSELKRKKKASGDEEKESEEGVSLDDLIAKKKED